MAYATPDDVALRLGRDLDDQEALIVGVRLADVELLIRAKIPDLDGMVLDSEIDEGLLVMIESEAVLRLIRNPDGHFSETDGNYTYQISASVASGRLEILDHEWSLLGVTRGSFVIAPRINVWRDPWYTPWTPGYEAGEGSYPIHPAVWWGDS